MGTITPAVKRKKPRDPITSSKPYQWLVKQEQAGKLKNIGFGSPGTPGAGLERRLDKVIRPRVEKLKKKIYGGE